MKEMKAADSCDAMDTYLRPDVLVMCRSASLGNIDAITVFTTGSIVLTQWLSYCDVLEVSPMWGSSCAVGDLYSTFCSFQLCNIDYHFASGFAMSRLHLKETANS